jgi:small-conductance mechanosensitive channel
MNLHRRRPIALLVLGITALAVLPACGNALSASPPPPETAPPVARESRSDSAPVELDGTVLFRVREIAALSAAQRAAEITANIEALATDPSFRPETLRAEDRGDLTAIVGGRVVIMSLDEEEARLEGVQRSVLAPVYVTRIRRAIEEYRDARNRTRLVASIGRAAAAVVIAAVLLVLLLWLLRRGEAAIQRTFDRRTGTLTAESRQILRVERLWQSLRGVLGLIRVAAVLLLVLLLLQYVLAQFPWTRRAGLRMFEYVASSLGSMGRGFVAAIPQVLFLVILFLITRYVLSLARLYFEALERGSIRLRQFEPEWAQPTYNAVRVAVIVSALVIAYPYIPGSNSDVFKGISILAGVLLSFGSTSAVANIIAGYMLIYRRAYRVGDRVKIGDVFGDVTEMRLQVTHIQTPKKEEITIPNAMILGSEVTNFSKPARQGGVVLHTEVGIGYGVPWRQVEAMLIEAAHRTAGLLKEPPPFVLQRKLGDFAVTYQINAYSALPTEMLRIYAELHRNILDQFNEHGVQIMVPAYEGDPEKPKVVAKEQWFAAPAGREPASSGGKKP